MGRLQPWSLCRTHAVQRALIGDGRQRALPNALLSLAVLMGLAWPAAAQISVPVSSNLYAAGHSFPEAPVGAGAGTLPPFLRISPTGLTTFQFPSVVGEVSYCPTCGTNGPDGNAGASICEIASWRGISAFRSTQGRAMMGVFLSDAEPVDPPPAPITFTAFNFTSLSPQVGQLFFIGDGRTNNAAALVQSFVAPTGATRLYLGFVDGFCGSSHGSYGDNAGHVLATVEVIGCPTVLVGPEPVTACAGSVAALSVIASGTLPVQYQWRKGGVPIASGAAGNPTAATDTLVITDVSIADAGTYDCIVTRASGGCSLVASTAAMLNVCKCFACAADFNEDGGVDGDDVSAFFGAWESGICDADVNQDGGVDGDDIGLFFGQWERGGC